MLGQWAFDKDNLKQFEWRNSLIAIRNRSSLIRDKASSRWIRQSKKSYDLELKDGFGSLLKGRILRQGSIQILL